MALNMDALRKVREVVGSVSLPKDVTPETPADLGANYDTGWARQPWARAIRYVLIETVTRSLVWTVARSTVLHADRIKDLESPVVFAANHSSHLDTSVMLNALPTRFRHRAVVAAGADYFFDKRWKAIWWSLTINVIPVERTKVTRKLADLAAKLIDDNWSLVIFPEGGRTPDGWMQPFRGGAAYLSRKKNVPVVPVFIEGTRAILGKGARQLRPGRSHVLFGEPICPEPDEDVRELNKRIEHAVMVLADEWSTDWYSAQRRARTNTSPTLLGPETSHWIRAWRADEAQHRSTRRRWPHR